MPDKNIHDSNDRIYPSEFFSDAQAMLAQRSPAFSSDSEDSEKNTFKQYCRSLAESEPLSAEEERALWSQMNDLIEELRSKLYRFAFIHSEHLKILKQCAAPDQLMDFFPLSSMPAEKNAPDDSSGDFNHRNMTRKIKLFKLIPKWAEDIEGNFSALKNAAKEQQSSALEDFRQKGIDILKRYPVLTQQLYDWRQAAMQFSDEEIEQKTILSKEEFRQILRDTAEIGERIEKCRQKVITANLRLVISVAKNYANHANIPLNDLIQEGNIGMITALDKFEFKKGHKFATYATYWIRHAIVRAIANQSRVIRLPFHMLSEISRINKTEHLFIQENGREPSIDELADLIEMPKARVSAIKKMACQAISLQAPVSGDDESGFSLEDVLCEAESGDPAKMLAFNMMREHLMKALEELPEREQQIISLRFGLGKYHLPLSLTEVSERCNLSRERVRQLENKSIRKLRDPVLLAYLKDYLSK